MDSGMINYLFDRLLLALIVCGICWLGSWLVRKFMK